MSLKATLNTLRTLGRGVVQGLPEATEDRNPIELYGEWFEAATEAGIFMPETLALATSTPDGVPSVRNVLLKGFDDRGFVFYTNYRSRKASELESNPRAALLSHWSVLERQVRIEGPVERVGTEESAAYFASRPRGSRIGAWASDQSSVLMDRGDLARRFEEEEERFKGQDVPLPPFWGGYRVAPERIEFWQGRANRLHDRLTFMRDGDTWRTERLYP
jgi:pyridoxamine 5'-phosphate oxidase